MSASDVSRVVSLVYFQPKRKSLMRVENSYANLDFNYLILFVI